MLTIKWIADNGYEHIYQGVDVRYIPPSAKCEAPAKTTVEFDITSQCRNADGAVACSIDSGSVYVMNEAGKTVADYHLGPPEVNRAA